MNPEPENSRTIRDGECRARWCREPIWRGSLCKVCWYIRARNRCASIPKDEMKHILMAEQEFRCANPGCRVELASYYEAHLDHDHACCPAGKACVACTRGLLCRFCNSMLGLARDDPERLRGGADYLEAFQEHARPMAIVERDRRGYSFHKDRRLRPSQVRAIRAAVAAEKEAALDGQSGDWKYRPKTASASPGNGGAPSYERADYARSRAVARGLVPASRVPDAAKGA